jgi:hypothetical protein
MILPPRARCEWLQNPWSRSAGSYNLHYGTKSLKKLIKIAHSPATSQREMKFNASGTVFSFAQTSVASEQNNCGWVSGVAYCCGVSEAPAQQGSRPLCQGRPTSSRYLNGRVHHRTRPADSPSNQCLPPRGGTRKNNFDFRPWKSTQLQYFSIGGCRHEPCSTGRILGSEYFVPEPKFQSKEANTCLQNQTARPRTRP